MKYFLLSVDKSYEPPRPVKWYGILDQKTLERTARYQMPEHLLFTVEKHMQMVYTDVLTYPCFMVSEMVRNVIRKYDASIYFLRIVLYDGERKKSRAYYIPYLEDVACVRSTDLRLIHMRQVIVYKDDMAGRVIARTEKENHQHIIVRMDLVESILRRGAVGIGLQEIRMI